MCVYIYIYMHIHSHVVGAEARTSFDNWDNLRNSAQELRGPAQGPRSPRSQRPMAQGTRRSAAKGRGQECRAQEPALDPCAPGL